MKHRVSLFAGVACTFFALPVAAQEASSNVAVPAAVAERSTTDPDSPDIVVTATRRNENLQQVPVAVQAVSGGELESRNLTTTTDIQFAAPSVTFLQGPGSTSANFFIRGVGTTGGAPSLEESVGLVIDGISVGSRGAGISNLLDVNQVEVLRGPQGTLFGRNASAGLINIRSNAPVMNDFQAIFRASYGSLNDIRGQAVLNIPVVTDRIALRVAGLYTDRDSLQLNRTNNTRFNDLNEYYFRGRARFDVTDNLRIDITGDYNRTRTTCCQMTLLAGQASNALVQAILATGVRPGPENDDSANTAGFPTSRSVNSSVTAEVNYDFGPATLTALLGHREFTNMFTTDADFSPLPTTRLLQTQLLRQDSEEVRLTSNTPLFGVIDYVVGLYFYQADSSRDRTQNTTRTLSPVRNESSAGFGLLTIHANDRLRFLLGGRLTSDTVRQDDFSGPVTATTLPRITGGTAKATDFSYRAGVQYDFGPNVMGFATVTEGYKGPAFAAIPAAGVGVPPIAIAVRPEVSTEYSIGLRSQFFDRRLTLNLTLFRQEFSDYQAVTFDPVAFVSYLRNAGSARTQGLEWEIIVRPSSRWTLSAVGGWVDAKYTDYTGVQCSTIFRLNFPASCPGGLFNATGERLTNAPEFSNNFLVAYTLPIQDRFELTLQGSHTYRSSVTFIVGDPYSVQKAYGLFNFNLGLADIDDRWGVSVFARNIFDQNFSSGIIAAPGALGASTVRAVTIEARRTLGVALDLRF